MLMSAAQAASAECVAQLLAGRADARVLAADGRSALHFAAGNPPDGLVCPRTHARGERATCVRLLLAAQADPAAGSPTALELARLSGGDEGVALLDPPKGSWLACWRWCAT